MKTFINLVISVLITVICFGTSIKFGGFGLIHNSISGTLVSVVLLNAILNKEIILGGRIVGALFLIIWGTIFIIIPTIDARAVASSSLLGFAYFILVIAILIPTLGFPKNN